MGHVQTVAHNPVLAVKSYRGGEGERGEEERVVPGIYIAHKLHKAMSHGANNPGHNTQAIQQY